MGKSGIGDSFKERLGQHEAPIDHDQLIADMGLGSKDRKRLVIWVVLACLLLGLISAVLFYEWIQNRSEQLSSDSDTSTQLAQLDFNESKELVAFEITEQNVITDQANTETKNTASTNGEKASVDNSSYTNSTTNTTIDNVTVLKKNRRDNDVSEINDDSQNNIPAILESDHLFSDQDLLEVTPKKARAKTVITKQEEQKYEFKNSPQEPTNTATGSSRISNYDLDRDHSSQKALDPANIASVIDKNSERISIPVKYLAKSSLEPLAFQSSSKASHPNIIQPKNKKISPWSIAAQSEVFAFSNSFITSTSEDTEYAQLRSNLENPLEGFRHEVLFQYNLTDYLYLKSGLQYARYNRSFNYHENFTQTVEKDIVTDIKVNYFGDTITTSELMSSEENVNRNWTRHQHLNQINMPLYLGVCKPIGRWNTYVEAGIQINLFQWFEGSILDENFAVVSNADIYRSNFANQASLAAGFVYTLNRRAGINCGIRYGRSLNSTTKDGYSLNENIQQLGLTMGVNYKL